MKQLLRAAMGCLLLAWLHAGLAADTGWLENPQNTHAKVRLQAQPADSDTQHTRLLLSVRLEKGWKTYWRSPGEGGIAPSLVWDDATIAPATTWFWPMPARFDVAGMTTQGYHDGVSFPLIIAGKTPARLAGTLTLPVCSNVCILTDYSFILEPAFAGDGTNFSREFTVAMGKVPITQGLTEHATAGYHAGYLVISAEREQGWQDPQLFIDTLEGSAFGKPAFTAEGQRLEVTVPVTDEWGDVTGDITGRQVSVVLSDQGLAQQLTLRIEALPVPTASVSALWKVALMALVGGFILNLMPCVLPVLGMKLGSILQVEARSRRRVRVQFLASSAGIITSFLALALLMTLLRYSHQTLGWGIQFQSPWFIGLMVTVTALFTANLLGLFEINLPSRMNTHLATRKRTGLTGHFAEGAFATLLATPCSAPFLGTAVAFALAAPLPVLWGVFLMSGLGMSLPWLMIALSPGLALRLPRPGRWMVWLRLALGFMMLTACLWLLSLMQNHVPASAVIALAAVLLLALIVASMRRYGIRGTVMASGIGFIAGLLIFFGLSVGTASQSVRDEIRWQPLSEQAIHDALAAQKVVFVDVTADWCVTCKANKFNVMLRDDVQKALTRHDVVALRGDWSLPSVSISAFLQKRGSVAVPFNQIYGPNLPAGEILSPLLTRDAVLQGLNNARGDK